jgi:hypothetical protein
MCAHVVLLLEVDRAIMEVAVLLFPNPQEDFTAHMAQAAVGIQGAIEGD